MPTESKKYVKLFVNHYKQMPVPFAIYADFENIITPYFNKVGDKSEITKHVDLAMWLLDKMGFWLSCFLQKGKCCRYILNGEVYRINCILKKPTLLLMAEENDKDFQSGTHCWICKENI